MLARHMESINPLFCKFTPSLHHYNVLNTHSIYLKYYVNNVIIICNLPHNYTVFSMNLHTYFSANKN